MLRNLANTDGRINGQYLSRLLTRLRDTSYSGRDGIGERRSGLLLNSSLTTLAIESGAERGK